MRDCEQSLRDTGQAFVCRKIQTLDQHLRPPDLEQLLRDGQVSIASCLYDTRQCLFRTRLQGVYSTELQKAFYL
jgi:hypothetical protein